MNMSLMEALLRERQSDAHRHLAGSVAARNARRASEATVEETVVRGSCLDTDLANTPGVTSCPELQLLVVGSLGRGHLDEHDSMPAAS
jgi:hypothetical protein